MASPDRGNATPGTFAVAICGGCSAGVTLPPATAEDLAAFYPPGYGPHTGVERRVLQLISKAIQRLQGALAWRRPPIATVAARAPGRGLDVGAGRGDLAAMFAGHGWRMTAIEPSPGAVTRMLQRGLDARAGVLATVPLPRGCFDFAVFQHSLEHTLDPVADLRLAYDTLKPGGLVLISVPNFGSWQRRLFNGAWYHLDLPRHRVHFTGRALELALRGAGFRDVALDRSSSAVGLPASLQYRLAGRCLFPEGLALRIAAGLCSITLPMSRGLDRFAGEADTLHAVAHKPPEG
jgi:SAM-dependent methyltransferase